MFLDQRGIAIVSDRLVTTAAALQASDPGFESSTSPKKSKYTFSPKNIKDNTILGLTLAKSRGKDENWNK